MTTMTSRMRRLPVVLAALALLVAGLTIAQLQSSSASTGGLSAYVPPVKHVFVVNIENKGFDSTWGSASAAPYLSQTLRSQGVLLNTYYGTAHNSQPNYVAQISGQGPNEQMQGDCQVYSQFAGTGTAAPGQAVGQRLRLPHLGAQPHRPAPEPQPHLARLHGGHGNALPSPGAEHPGHHAEGPARRPVRRAARPVHVLRFRHRLAHLRAARGGPEPAHAATWPRRATTPNLTYITPNLCHDGHDAPCVDGQPGGLTSVDAWMKVWIPKILASPAYKTDGMLVITADESDGPADRRHRLLR